MSDSTTVQGNAFRDSVRRLIELTPGCSNVHTEYQLGTQQVDCTTRKGLRSALCGWLVNVKTTDIL